MPLAPGDKLGPYEILEPIGKGGMGEVFRARDTRLQREVAIKISAEQFSERFEREARAIAALNHPNICTLHDVGPNYLVMELVEGPTLADRIKSGAIPLEESLAIARQIADALGAAHDKGITHRDLKPANVKVTPEGTVKVLDFGLAKVGPRAASGGDHNPDESPTISMAATQAGVILGTAAYMAPEQARGKQVDKRADIWAFGVVLYEMVTGKRLFQGEDLTDTLARVVRDAPEVTAAPPQLRRVLEACLAKDPKQRLRDIGDVWRLLDDPAAAPPPVAGPVRKSWLIPTLAAAVLLMALAALASVHFRETPPELQAVAFSMDAPPETGYASAVGSLAPSPDGRYVIFGAAKQGSPPMLWLRPLDSSSARPLPGTEGGSFPTWSPDSRSVAFRADGKLKRIDIEGGAPLVLADAPNDPVSPTGTWNRDGVILFGSNAGLQRVSASGGGASLLTKADPAAMETGHGYPQFLPDGNRFLYFVASGDPSVQGVYASSLDRPEERRQILRTDVKAVYVPPRAAYPGYLLWMQEATLLAQRFDPDTLERQGDPASVAEDIVRNGFRATYWASDAGLLIYFSGTRPDLQRPVVWVGRDGKQIGEALPAALNTGLALSPDGGRIAVERREGGAQGDIWIWESAREVMTRLTFDAARDSYPLWSPDGQWVAFSSWRNDSTAQVFRAQASGGGEPEALTEGPHDKLVTDWSRDGRYLLYQELNPETGWDVMALPLTGDRRPIPVVQTPFGDQRGFLSPDGRWVAYASNESGRYEMYVRAFPAEGAPSGRWQVSDSAQNRLYRWREDGRELYFRSGDRMMAVAIRATPQGIQADTPRELFTMENQVELDVSGDGQRFLFILNPGTAGDSLPLSVVSNWQAALRR